VIRFDCPQCGKRLKADDEFAGRRVKCSRCAAELLVPEPEPILLIPPHDASASADPLAAAWDGADAPLNLRGRPVEDDGLDMTPMVDVTFLLLIFFMVTAAFALQKSIEVPTPDSSEGATAKTVEDIEQDDDYVIVRIDKDDTVWVNDAEAITEQDLLSKLKEARSGEAGTSSPGPSKLLVMANGDAHHEKVVMVLDAGTASGMDEVRLAADNEDL
jgi:biopolymer transport protein ExbD